jgi:replication-associated recombination protein RarA
MQLHEKYRPKTFADFVGHPAIIKRIEILRQRGLSGRAYFLTGLSGSGKTTLARLIAAEVADEFCTEELDASSLTPAALREIEKTMRTYGIPGANGLRGRAYLINEAHGLRKDAVRQLLVLLERLPPHVVVIFTSTIEATANMLFDNDDGGPLMSRCIVFELSSKGLNLDFAFGMRAKRIAEAEGFGVHCITACCDLVKKHKFNLRAVLQAIDSGELSAA